ncbi:hypothetical protein BX600DRAFT_512565 [Xylariales sp. PMI_506]|nr:hypothetical protein BX600DRAFT_512565 [Xylariales sp. PMI_506]
MSDDPEAGQLGVEAEKSVRSSTSHWEPEPGFAHVDGDIGGSGYNETTVDIIAVPCPGASPVDTWTRDPLPDGYFGLPSQNELGRYSTVKELPGRSILSPAINRHLPKATHLWIRQGIRMEVNTARVLLYRHRELHDGLTLDQLADDLLEQICEIRRDHTGVRPLFFVCHSIGGLVAKLALVKANQRENLRWMMYGCHGMTFFATPHRGSSYLSMPNLRESIQHLLYLSRPLPRSITDELRLNHKPLLKLHDEFTDIASEIRIWTFYETTDSQLSGLGTSEFDEVHFSAPIASIKSSLVASRHEQAFSLEVEHANCASFGPENTQIMHSYLEDLGRAVRQAEKLSASCGHNPLRLAENVKMELIGFYDDPDPNTVSDVRLYVSRHYLKEFLSKGPERCLQERLNTVAPRPHRGMSIVQGAITGSPGFGNLGSGALGIWNNVQDIGQRIFRSGSSQSRSSSPGAQPGESTASPEIVVTSHLHRQPAMDGTSRAATEPASQPRRSRGLKVPSLTSPGFHLPGSRGSSASSHMDDGNDDGDLHRTLSDPGVSDISPRTQTSTAHAEAGRGRTRGQPNDQDHIATTSSRHKSMEKHDAAIQDLTAGFSRPEPSKRKFMWIHLPFNNPHWVKSIFDTLSETQDKNYVSLLRNEYWMDRHVQGRHYQAHASYVRPGSGFVSDGESHSPRPSSASASGRTTPALNAPTYLYLFMPYLHYDTYQSIVKRRNIIRRRMAHGRTRPVPKDIANLDSLEMKVIWKYIDHDPPLNSRRTLDQYGYPSLRDTYARDDDQMLYKLTKERPSLLVNNRYDMSETRAEKLQSASSPSSQFASLINVIRSEMQGHTRDDDDYTSDLEHDIIDGNVLMVDQLWLWAVDATTLTTFFPKRESQPTEGLMFQQADLRNSVYNELNGDLTGRCENALDLAAFIALHAITVLLDRASHPDLEIFRIFEECVGILTERMTSSLKRFRMQSFKDRIRDSDSEDSEFDDNRSESIKKRHKRELERAERENRENTSALLELRDMEDELNTMKTLFKEQTAVVQKMREIYDKPELRETTSNGRRYLDEALGRLAEYEKQVADMMGRIEVTRTDYEKLLEMVQRQAQVDEVRWSRLQTELASTQNLSVMIFTTFTVIFLPLSFFTSLFGMNTREWGGEDNTYLGLSTIGAIALPSSALLVALSLVLAFSSRVQGVFRWVFRTTRKGFGWAQQKVADAAARAARHRKRESTRLRRRRLQKQERERVSRRRRERGYDFWETVRLERRSEYQIPELNRKRPVLPASALGGGRRGTWRRLQKG